MSMFLFDEQPIFANKALAREIGLNEALVLQQINYWIEINKKSGNNYFEGRYWTYNSIRAWHEKDFDYMSLDTVKRTFSKLEKKGFLLVGHYNKDPRDKTKWYTINEEKLEELYLEIKEKKEKQEKEILEKAAKKAVPNALVQNAPMEKGKMPQCKDADCTNGIGQNAPMQYGNLPQPLPEITTDINTDISSNTSIHPSFYPIDDLFSRTEDGIQQCRQNKKVYRLMKEELKEQIHYDHLQELLTTETEKNLLEAILEIMIDVNSSADPVIPIGKEHFNRTRVMETFDQLEEKHIIYVIQNILTQKKKIMNVYSYLIKSLFTAPKSFHVTSDSQNTQGLPDWYSQIDTTPSSEELLANVLELQAKLKEGTL